MTEPTAPSGGSFLDRFWWTIVSPKRLFEDIAGGAPWWQPWVWVSLINVVIAWISLPIQIRLVSLNPGGHTADQVQQQIEAMHKYGFIGLISTPVVVLITSLILAGISYVVVGVLSEAASFKRFLTLYFYASIVTSLGLLLGTIITRMRGMELIHSLEDAVTSFGPAIMLSPGHKILYSVLSSFDVFYIWFYVLIGVGAMHVFRLSNRAAILVVTPVVLLHVLLALLSARVAAFG